MNVLDIPKQIDEPLGYTFHAMDRALERNVPIPKYLPKNSKCLKIDKSNGQTRYTISYFYNDEEYCLVLSENFKVVTVYPLHNYGNGLRDNQRKTYRQELKELFQKLDKMVVLDDYICMESEMYNGQNYA
jgi:hypothetical protein